VAFFKNILTGAEKSLSCIMSSDQQIIKLWSEVCRKKINFGIQWSFVRQRSVINVIAQAMQLLDIISW